MIRLTARILLLLFALGLGIIIAKAQVIPVSDCCLQAITLQRQVNTLTTALSDSTNQIDRAWQIIAAYRTETANLRAGYKQSLSAAQELPLQALKLVEDYQGRGCFLGLCYRKRMRKIREVLVKIREP